MSHLPPNPTKLLSLPDDLLLLVLTSSRVDDILAARYASIFISNMRIHKTHVVHRHADGCIASQSSDGCGQTH